MERLDLQIDNGPRGCHFCTRLAGFEWQHVKSFLKTDHVIHLSSFSCFREFWIKQWAPLRPREKVWQTYLGGATITTPTESRLSHKMMCPHPMLSQSIESPLRRLLVLLVLTDFEEERQSIDHTQMPRVKSNAMCMFGELFYFLPDGQQLIIYIFIIENLSKMEFQFYWRHHLMRNIRNNITSCLTLHWRQRSTGCLVLEYYVLWKYCWLEFSEAIGSRYM